MCDDHYHGNSPKFDLETRRSILWALGIGVVGSVAASAAASATLLPGMKVAPTPGFDLIQGKQAHNVPRPLVATPNDILGPFWRAGAPFASNIVPKDAKGQRIVMSGTVRDTQGKPVEGVVMDFWNANDSGQYDLSNPFQQLMPDAYRFRGLVKSGPDGAYQIETIVPGKYRIPPNLPGFESFNGLLRPAHIHLMTSHNGTVPLITQIYFNGDDEIAKDPWASKSPNVTDFDKTASVWKSKFDVVLVRATA